MSTFSYNESFFVPKEKLRKKWFENVSGKISAAGALWI